MISAARLIEIAALHVGEPYVYGIHVPKNDPTWKQGWDCAEFGSYCVYQAAGTLFGCLDNAAPPDRADAFTGAWWRDAVGRFTIPVLEAIHTPGAFLLRAPAEGKGGHLALSCGDGSTIEAHSTAKGVVYDFASGRRWSCGVRVPGFAYTRPDVVQLQYTAPRGVLRLARPRMRGESVRALQARINAHGAHIDVDGTFGTETQAAVLAFQRSAGLLVDGEVGAITWAALMPGESPT